MATVLEIGPEIRSTIQQAAAQLGADPERIRRRKIKGQRRQELDSARARMLSERMGKWRDEAKRDWPPYKHSNMTETGEARAKEAEAGMAAEIVALPGVRPPKSRHAVEIRGKHAPPRF